MTDEIQKLEQEALVAAEQTAVKVAEELVSGDTAGAEKTVLEAVVEGIEEGVQAAAAYVEGVLGLGETETTKE